MEGKEWEIEVQTNWILRQGDRLLVDMFDSFEPEELQEIADKLNSYEKLKKDSDFEINRIFEWLTEGMKEPAQTKFTAGPTRNLAKEIEFRFSELKKMIADLHNETVDQYKEIKGLKKERDELRDMLERLVNLKEYKDKNGKDDNYLKSQPIVWEDAKSLLNKPQ